MTTDKRTEELLAARKRFADERAARPAAPPVDTQPITEGWIDTSTLHPQAQAGADAVRAMAYRNRTATLAALVDQIRAADEPALGQLHAELLGYNPFEDDLSITTEDVRGTLLDFVRELCAAEGIHCADVGLGQDTTE